MIPFPLPRPAPMSHITILLANHDTVADELLKGAFVVITDDRLRIRALSI
ncbi:hypothetical protein Psuf_038920 [Phytohabitans suffuscus]|uniref:Uncharacterized protein n=1 Tax=Phytohabitans suffuscus TaxID=624315 RepID=A0A6F8YKN3_9ACTN|nr:hypothetical protein Psuf_038920 [Phytohabitans suffuscus]